MEKAEQLVVYKGRALNGEQGIVRPVLSIDDDGNFRALDPTRFPSGILMPHGKLDKMNAYLAKTGVYSKIVQKQITGHAGIRNSAAHGNSLGLTKVDVEQMLPAIAQFLASQLENQESR